VRAEACKKLIPFCPFAWIGYNTLNYYRFSCDYNCANDHDWFDTHPALDEVLTEPLDDILADDHRAG